MNHAIRQKEAPKPIQIQIYIKKEKKEEAYIILYYLEAPPQ